MMLCWGSVAMGQAGIRNSSELYALRLLLGAFEAGFVPTVFYYLSTLYPSYMLAFRLGLFAGSYAIAGAFSGLIAYGVFQIKSSKYQDWQLLFLIEGGLTLFMAIVSLVVLPRSVDTAWFLNEAERKHAVRRLDIDNPSIDAQGNRIQDNRKVTWRDARDALVDWRKLLLIVCNVLATIPVYVFGIFTPIIVRGMGYTGTLQANLMSVSPFVA